MFTVRTGITALEQMLGGNGIPAGAVVLVRGAPGTGKTTLSLQIMAEHLKDPENYGCFISLESPPDETIKLAGNRFHFRFPERQLQCIQRQDMEREFFGDKDPTTRNDAIAAALRAPLAKAPPAAPFLVVIDSINLFVDVLLERFPELNRRAAIHSACKTIQDTLGQAVVVITGEYDPRRGDVLSAASESFLCDILVELSTEPVASPPRQGEIDHIENRSFCRVLKSRSGRNQLRRCCYDIVSEIGLVFYETYPGDGRVLLFRENGPQRAVVSELFKADVPLLYPTLRCDTFDRDNLHHVLGNQRRFQHIPERSDLYLASFDTYWITWYVERRQQELITELIKKRLTVKGVPAGALIGAVHRHALADNTEQTAVREQVRSVIARTLPEVSAAKIDTLLKEAREAVKSEEGQRGIFELIACDALRFMGHRQGILVPELQGGPHETAIDRRYRSVPYNLNVGLLVCRDDLLDALTPEQEQRIDEHVRKICEYERRFAAADAAKEDTAIGFLAGAGKVKTWEQVAAICQVTKKHLVIESKTFDSTMVMLLEMIWAQGSQFEVGPDYRIRDWEQLRVGLLRTFALLNYMFEHGIIQRDSTLEPEAFCRRYNDHFDNRANPDWMFARQWYSTLIKSSTTPRPDREFVPINLTGGSPLLWEQKSARLRIEPVPTSVFNLAHDRGPQHVPCLGEWHLVMIRGSENQALGMDLINWALSSQGTCDWAFRGALMPTAKSFYEVYGGARCFKMERPGNPLEALPTITFDEMRGFAGKASSRSRIFDYRRCMRPIHGLFEALRSSVIKEPDDLRRRVDGLRTSIEALAEVRR